MDYEYGGEWIDFSSSFDVIRLRKQMEEAKKKREEEEKQVNILCA